ncbi:Sodium:solute symporter family-domain-containing protein [Xylariaceae sp. FL0662B]|nr:Sodium:solute symporter family-domain-containing protein [Xylariaceae sp. FL0662B]
MSTDAFKVSLLGQDVGYGVVIGLGVLFAVVILIAVKLQKLYLNEDSGESEMFMVANRTVGTGLTCSAVFSSWMWINETVFSSVQCYKYGIAAPMWFGSGVCFQISLMAVLGVLVKIRVPHAHTSLEIVRIRYGDLGHFTFIVLNLINNIIGCASMIVTGSQILVGLTGVNIAAATILIPLGVVLYTAVGGLKATFLTDFLHTTIALILIVYFTIAVLTHQRIGGVDGLYDMLLATAEDNYIDGNYQGSLLSFKSKGAIIYGIILKFGNLALVIMDTAFWQKSFAAEVKATVPGYNLAALSIFAVPWAMGTVMGLTARAFQDTSVYPFLPGGFSSAQVDSGYVMPYTIHALLGAGGSAGMLLLLFMAVTSTVSSSMIAVSSILSFDIYRTYINPKATDQQTVRASHLGVVFHGVLIAGITLGLNYGGANINWLSYSMNMVKCPGIFPLIFTILWSRQSKLAAVVSPVLGMLCGIAVWLSTTYALYGVVNMQTTAMQLPALYGELTSVFAPLFVSVFLSYVGPKEVFDWRDFLNIGLVGDDGDGEKTAQSDIHPRPSTAPKAESHIGVKGTSNDIRPTAGQDISAEAIAQAPEIVKAASSSSSLPMSDCSADERARVHPYDAKTLAYLHRWYKIAWVLLLLFVTTTFVAWPLPLYRDYIFTKSFFGGWVSVSIVWQFVALAAVVVFPVYDGWGQTVKVGKGLWRYWFKSGETA